MTAHRDAPMKRICFITYYSGEFPNYFRFFVESCKKNSDVNFLIFNDRLETDTENGNISLRKLSLQEFEDLTAKKTGISAKIERGYKLADFKPLYGLLFEDLLRDFDFWGYCDLDQIFGNIRRFVTNELLSDYDVITTGEKWVSGHFTLLKNNEFCRRLFERSPSHRLMLQDSGVNWYLEESCKRWNGDFYTIEYLIENDMPVSMYDIVRNLEKSGEIKPYFKDVIREHSLRGTVDYLYQNGDLIDLTNGEEFLYHHLITIKNFWGFFIPGWKSIPDEYRITSKGIQSMSEGSGWRHALWRAKRACYYVNGVKKSVLKHLSARGKNSR